MPSKKFAVEWTESAAADLRGIVLYIAENSLQNARQIFAKIKTECENLEKFPEIGKVPAELEALQIGGYRELVVTPWRIFYRKDTERIVVLAVIDSRRNIDDAVWKRMMR